MSLISFEDKEKLIDNSNIIEKNKLTAANVNEIKKVVNENEQNAINRSIYTDHEQIVGYMQYQNGLFKPRYRKTFILTGSNYIAEQSSFDVSSLNIEYLKFDEVSIDYISNSGKAYKRPAFGAAVPGTNVDYFAVFFRDDTIQLRLKQDVNDNIKTLNAIIITLLYTKTTDDFAEAGVQQ